MVFLKLVHWIAGIFGSRQSGDSKVFVKKHELDEIVSVVMQGFDKMNSRMDSFQQDNLFLKENADEKFAFLESRSNDAFAKVDLLQNKFDNIVAGGNLEKCIIESMSRQGYVSKEDFSDFQETFDEKFRSLENGLFDKIMVDVRNEVKSSVNIGSSFADEIKKLSSKIDAIDMGSHNVATESNDVATKLSQEPVQKPVPSVLLPQGGLVEHRVVETPIGVINTVVTEKSIKGKLPSALLPIYNVLLNAEKRISYAELAQRINKKEATARSYVNDLRKYGISIEEESGSNGRKFIRLSKRVRQEHIIPE